MGAIRKTRFTRLQAMFQEVFGLGPAAALSTISLISLVTIFAVFWFFHSAPPNTITITSGPKGSIYQRNAEKYAKILARNGVKLKIIPSEGSVDNLKKLTDPKFRVDIGFVQGGVSKGLNIDKLVSLGSISYEPLFVFYRGAVPIDLLSQLIGKRLAIGEVGSGTHTLSLALLAANGIEPGGVTALVELDSDAAAEALPGGKVDAVFLMGDSVSTERIRMLLRTPGIRLFSFTQAEGYTRRINYLNRLELPKGSIDLGKDIPAHDVYLISPMVELIARPSLHPALSDLLLEAATKVHGRAGILQRRGEFPAPLEHEFRISDDAGRYYKSGKSFLYRILPFWLASLANRILVVFVPMVVLLLPGMRIIPSLYRWRTKSRIYRSYRALLALEQDLMVHYAPEKREELLGRLDDIEKVVNGMKVPAFFAEQFYVLRGHISFVRGRLMNDAQSP